MEIKAKNNRTIATKCIHTTSSPVKGINGKQNKKMFLACDIRGFMSSIALKTHFPKWRIRNNNCRGRETTQRHLDHFLLLRKRTMTKFFPPNETAEIHWISRKCSLFSKTFNRNDNNSHFGNVPNATVEKPKPTNIENKKGTNNKTLAPHAIRSTWILWIFPKTSPSVVGGGDGGGGRETWQLSIQFRQLGLSVALCVPIRFGPHPDFHLDNNRHKDLISYTTNAFKWM